MFDETAPSAGVALHYADLRPHEPIHGRPPGELWVMTETAANYTASNSNRYIRTPDGRLSQVPCPGLYHYPEVVNIQEPPVAW